MDTHITVVLDRSGSMSHLTDETIGAYNQWLAEIKTASKGKTVDLTLLLFDDKLEYVYTDTKLAAVKKLTREVYYTRGMTALNDAFGRTILEMKEKTSKKDRAVILVMTDGLENASREISAARLRTLVAKADERPNWTIQYIGANQDAFAVGRQMGLTQNSTRVTATHDWAGTQAAYGASSGTLSNMLRGNDAKAVNITQHDYDTIKAELTGDKPPKQNQGGRPIGK